MDSCGTTEVREQGSERWSSIHISWSDQTWSMNQRSASPVNPYNLSFEIRIEWLRVANACDRLINKVHTIFPLFHRLNIV